MFLIILFIILGWCAIILWSMYYNIVATQTTYGNTNTYYWAYYGAISSIERWLLMTKLKYPTYTSSWWFIWNQVIWSISNQFAWNFRKLSQWSNTMMRYINSKTTKISSYIDTKTLRNISFYQYNDTNPESYSSNNISKTPQWVYAWLSFSWYTTPSKWERQSINIREVNMDFNWFFNMNVANRIVRSLWYNFRLDQTEWVDSKDYPLSWKFEFIGNEINPWPAERWDLDSEYTIGLHDNEEDNLTPVEPVLP